MLKTVHAKIGALTGALSLVIIFVFGLFLYFSLRIQLFRSVDQGLVTSAQQLLAMVEYEEGQLRFRSGGVASLNLDEDDIARLVSPSGAVLDRRGGELVPAVAPAGRAENAFHTVRFYEPEEGEQEVELVTIRLLSTPVRVQGERVGYLQVGRDIEPVQEALSGLLQLLLIAGPILVGVATLGGYWLAGQVLAPIEKIRRQAASIQARDLNQRLELRSEDEVGRLARTFNEMLNRLENSFRRQRRFTADASHELRTPLAVIQGEVEVALERPRSHVEYVETLQSVGTEARRMSRLVNELLLLARADADELRLEIEQIDLADLLRVLVDQMARQAQESGVRLQVDLPASLPAQVDRDRILELFINLLENAFLHAPGNQVELFANSSGSNLTVTVADHGPGIPDEHLPHIFERFYRVDQARQGPRGGSGLGLAIAQEIARAHGGEISVQSQVGKGTTFTVRIPQ